MTIPFAQPVIHPLLADALSFRPDPAALARANCRSLASIIADLINENEPLLRGTHDGCTVTVIERGGMGSMIVTVNTYPQGEAGPAQQAPATDQ